MSRVSAGKILLIGFMLATSLRDVTVSGLFRHVDFFLFALVAFGTCCIVFIAIAMVRSPWEWRILTRLWKDALWINLTTATAWLSYFKSLKLIQPSITNVIFVGVAPFAVSVFAALGIRARSNRSPKRLERWLHKGMLLALVFIAFVVLSGRTSEGAVAIPNAILGMTLAICSGFCITAETVISKRMNECGLSPGTVLATRFLLVSLISLVAVSFHARDAVSPSPGAILQLSVLSFLLITLPSYLAQVGLSWTSPLTTNVTLALGPIFVLGAQWAVSGLVPSGFSIAGMLLYAIFAMWAAIIQQAPRPAADAPVVS